jgi:hypothetical protein
MPDERPDSLGSRDSDTPDGTAGPERTEGIPGSRAAERDFGEVDPRKLDLERADYPQLDPDEWFARTFPHTGDFAKWLKESDFLADGADEDGMRGWLIHQASTDPAGAWKRMRGVGHDKLRDAYAAWVFGGTDDERDRPRDQTAREAAVEPGSALSTMPGADGETVPPGAGTTKSRPEPEQAARWRDPSVESEVTLPDGSKVTVEFDTPPGNPDQPPTRQRTIDGDGNVGEWQPIEVVPDDLLPPPTGEAPSTEPTSEAGAGFGGIKMIVIGGAAAAIAGVIAFLALSGGGGGDSGPWSVTDPQGDFAPTFADKEGIANPSAAGDVTRLDVAVADGNTTVTVTFDGPAEGLMTEGGEELAAALQFIPVGDERWIDILFNEDGTVKISDAPSGSRITATWTASNVLVFEILGLTPASGATVRFATIQRDGFAHSTDEVSLATGGAGAVVATAFVTDDSGGSGGVPDAPEIVRACDVIDVELVSAALGPAVLLHASGDVKTSRCSYEMASGMRLDLSVQRRSNPRSDAFRPFRRSNGGVVEIRSLDWSDEGEVRASEFEESAGASLLAFVHTSDPVGREIYVRISTGGAPGQSAALAATIEEFAKLLRDAILEAQP